MCEVALCNILDSCRSCSTKCRREVQVAAINKPKRGALPWQPLGADNTTLESFAATSCTALKHLHISYKYGGFAISYCLTVDAPPVKIVPRYVIRSCLGVALYMA